MKKLLGIIIVLCAAALFSLQAGAEISAVQTQPRQRYVAPPPQPRYVQQQYVQPVAQWASVSYTQQTVSQNFQPAQQSGASNSDVAQNLRQFSQQAQSDLNDFRK